MAHPNAEKLRAAFDAQTREDWPAVRDAFANDVVFHVAGKNRFSGSYRGKEEVFDLFNRRNESTGSKVELDVHAVLADDEHAVAMMTMRGERDGKRAEWKSIGMYHMRDGRIAEAWGFNEDQQAVDEFWS
ncbi:MAG: nuclear transport factor 2 family protein [Actinomycetota bacterium]